jgi:hypothetical protein
MTSNPAYSPCDPELGCRETAGEAGDLGQPRFSRLAEQLLVALGLIQRRKGMQMAEAGPGHGEHLGRGVELHGAGAEGDHRVDQREDRGSPAA